MDLGRRRYASVTPGGNVPVLNEEIVVHSLDCSCDLRFLVGYQVQSIAGGDSGTAFFTTTDVSNETGGFR